MPNKPKTPNRNAGRIPGETWERAAVAAAHNGEDRSQAITRLLTAYWDETWTRMTPDEQRAAEDRVRARITV